MSSMLQCPAFQTRFADFRSSRFPISAFFSDITAAAATSDTDGTTRASTIVRSGAETAAICVFLPLWCPLRHVAKGFDSPDAVCLLMIIHWPLSCFKYLLRSSAGILAKPSVFYFLVG
jgi:hypothetical protein